MHVCVLHAVGHGTTISKVFVVEEVHDRTSNCKCFTHSNIDCMVWRGFVCLSFFVVWTIKSVHIDAWHLAKQLKLINIWSNHFGLFCFAKYLAKKFCFVYQMWICGKTKHFAKVKMNRQLNTAQRKLNVLRTKDLNRATNHIAHPKDFPIFHFFLSPFSISGTIHPVYSTYDSSIVQRLQFSGIRIRSITIERFNILCAIYEFLHSSLQESKDAWEKDWLIEQKIHKKQKQFNAIHYD